MQHAEISKALRVTHLTRSALLTVQGVQHSIRSPLFNRSARSEARGYLSRLPHYKTVFRYLESEALTPYLKELISLSAAPLIPVESDFAVDASGFSTGQVMRWFDVKYGKKEDRRVWLKLHLMCGVKTQAN